MVVNEEQKMIFKQKGMDPYYKIWHTTGENMILYIYSGTGSIVTGEQNYPIIPGCLCFIGADKFHYTLPEVPEEYVRSKVFISREKLQDLYSGVRNKSEFGQIFTASNLVYARVSEKDQAYVERLLVDLSENLETDWIGETILECQYMRLLIFIYQNMISRISKPEGFAQKAVAYINHHIAEELEMDRICAAVPMSKYHFCRKFKEATGITVMQYVLQTRIALAKSKLQENKLSIGEISNQCGFCSQSYFCRIFKEETGCTPLQYRRNTRCQ